MKLKSFMIAIMAISVATVAQGNVIVTANINGDNSPQLLGSPDGGQNPNETYTFEFGAPGGQWFIDSYSYSFFYSTFGTALRSEASFAVWDTIGVGAPLFTFNYTADGAGAGSYSSGGFVNVGPFALTDSGGAAGGDFTLELFTTNDANTGFPGSEGIYAVSGPQFGVSFNVVPEPGAAGLLALIGVAAVARRRKR